MFESITTACNAIKNFVHSKRKIVNQLDSNTPPQQNINNMIEQGTEPSTSDSTQDHTISSSGSNSNQNVVVSSQEVTPSASASASASASSSSAAVSVPQTPQSSNTASSSSIVKESISSSPIEQIQQQQLEQQQEILAIEAAPAASSGNEDNTESTYHLKWIPWNSGKIPVVMQSINGPCPLIATMNVLLLREKVSLPTMLEQITASQLLTYLGECLTDSVPDEIKDNEQAMLNFEQNIHDAIEILPKLKTGLDVNVRFSGITEFEYTPECIIFDILRIPLYHGWISDPDLVQIIGNKTYNQLVDNIITNKSSEDHEVQSSVMLSEEFLAQTASQLTLFGLEQLKTNIKDNEIGILFRNNHFLTLFKREGELYTLVTDHGYLTEDNIIWETLDNVEGAGRFFDANFQLAEVLASSKQATAMSNIDERQKQILEDYLLAMELNNSGNGGSGGSGGVGG